MSIESMMPLNHLILCCLPLLLFAFNLSQHQGLSSESVLLIRWPKYWGFSFNISPSNEHPGLISFRMDWLDLLAVHGTLKSLFQHQSTKASVLHHSAFFMVQLLHPYMTIWTLVGKVISLLFNMQSRFVVAFLPGSKRLLFSWLQSPSVVILEPRNIKSVTISTFSPSICPEVMGLDAVIFILCMWHFKLAFLLFLLAHVSVCFIYATGI